MFVHEAPQQKYTIYEGYGHLIRISQRRIPKVLDDIAVAFDLLV